MISHRTERRELNSASPLQIYLQDINNTPLLTADEERDELSASAGVTVHGFSYALPILKRGLHRVKVYAIDPFSGHSVLIGTKTIRFQATQGR